MTTILEEAHHSLIIVEYDPLIDEDAQEMIECISKALKQASYEAKVLFYSSGLNPFSEDLTKLADCILCFEKARYYRYFICSSPLAAAMTFPTHATAPKLSESDLPNPL